MGRRNPIRVIGDPIRNGVTWLSDELIREGAHDRALGSDGLVLMAYVLSRASTRRVWETSAAQITEQFGWGGDRERARKAIDRAVKDHRLVLRPMLRGGRALRHRYEYVVCAGGRRFSDDELFEWTQPIVLPDNMHGSHAT